MIYFIQAGDGGPVKVGYAKHSARRRLKELQTGNPLPLRLVCTMPGERSLEAALHKVFHADRLHGEWFKPTVLTTVQTLNVQSPSDAVQDRVEAKCDPLLARVDGIVRSAGWRGIKKSDIRKKLGSNAFGAERVNNILLQLDGQSRIGRLNLPTSTARGRNAEVWAADMSLEPLTTPTNPRTSFKVWLRTQASRSGPIGHLAQDVIHDKSFPTSREFDIHADYLNFKEGATQAAYEALELAWHEWCEYCKPDAEGQGYRAGGPNVVRSDGVPCG